ncbi:hypothetical protein ACEQPO_13950 [Bacillus sp. SL00103]
MLHSDSNTPFLKRHTFFSTEKIELEANFFAMHLLFSSVQRVLLTVNSGLRHSERTCTKLP